MAGVTKAAVTKMLAGKLAPAAVGDRVNAGHPEAELYVQEKLHPPTQGPLPGVDILFTEALTACQSQGRWTPSFIRTHFNIGYNRAAKIREQLVAAGHCPPEEVAGPSGQSPAPKPPPKTRAKPKPKPIVHTSFAPPATAGVPVGVSAPEDLGELGGLTLQEIVDQHGSSREFLDWLKALKEIEAVREKRIKNEQSRGKLVSRDLVLTGVIDPFNSAHLRLLSDGAKAITAAVLAKREAGICEQEIEDYVADVVASFIRPVKAKVERNMASV